MNRRQYRRLTCAVALAMGFAALPGFSYAAEQTAPQADQQAAQPAAAPAAPAVPAHETQKLMQTAGKALREP